MSDEREIHGLKNIMGNDHGMLHHIHAPGEDGPDDPGASPFWEAQMHQTFGEVLSDALEKANVELGYCDYGFEDAWAAFARRLRDAGLDAIPLSLLDEAIQHLGGC